MMDIAGLIIGVSAALFVIWTIFFNLRRAKQGRMSCSCDCSAGVCMGCAKYQETCVGSEDK